MCERLNTPTDEGYARIVLHGPNTLKNAVSPEKAEIARKLYADKSNSIPKICKTLGISRATLWRYVNAGEEG
jgi:DNA invertase Pin-like site-specific DNA recombinase